MNEYLEFISWGFVAIALIGSVYNSKLDQKTAFNYWFISNLFFICFNLYFKHYGAASLYTAHWLLVIKGLQNIRIKNKDRSINGTIL